MLDCRCTIVNVVSSMVDIGSFMYDRGIALVDRRTDRLPPIT